MACSPIGIWMSLSMVAQGAQSTTLRTLDDVLRFPDADRGTIRTGLTRLIDDLNSYTGVRMSFSNVLSVTCRSPPDFSFLDTAKRVFRSQVIWDNLNKLDKFTEGAFYHSDIVIANKLNLEAKWAQPFGLSNKNYVTISGKYNVTSFPEGNASIIELPYKNKAISMFIIRPDKKSGDHRLLRSLEFLVLADILQRRVLKRVNMDLPKFNITVETDLDSKLGTNPVTGSIFRKTARFGAIKDDVMFPELGQRMFLKFDQLGTEAVTETYLASPHDDRNRGVYSRMKKEALDHPFIAMIATTGEKPVTLFFTGLLLKIPIQ